MALEIEKKYRITLQQRELIISRLNELDAACFDREFETNTIYGSSTIDLDGAVLRLRRTGDQAILTYKKRYTSPGPIKKQLEEETEVADGDVIARILARLGFTPSLIYEKRRETWGYGGTEIALDELPFGWFMEIEGPEIEIERVELELGITGLQAEESTYPGLTRRYGKENGGIIEARFPS